MDRCYVQGTRDHLYATVHFRGIVSFVENLEEIYQAISCMMNHLDKNPKPLIEQLNMEKLGRTTIGRIDLQHMTGMKSKKVTI